MRLPRRRTLGNLRPTPPLAKERQVMTSLRAALTVAILALGATLAFVQGAPDFSKVEIKATKIIPGHGPTVDRNG